MGSVELYNYDSENIQQLEVGLVTQQDVNNLTSGTYTYAEGKTLSVTVSSASGHKQITCTANWGFEFSDLDNILHDALNIRCVGVYQSNYTRYRPLNVAQTETWGWNEDYESYPWIEFSRTQDSGTHPSDFYEVQFKVQASGSVNINRAVQSNAYYGISCIMCPVFMDTSYIQANGTIGCIQAQRTDSNGTIIITYYPANFVNDTYDYDPGETGFKPTSAPTMASNPGIGGRGKNPDGSSSGKHPVYRTEDIAQPGAPNETKASLTGVGLLTMYKIDKSNLQELAKALYSQTILSAVANLAVNPLDAIVSLCIFPCEPTTSAATYIKLLNHLTSLNDLGVSALGAPLTSQYKTVDFGTLNVTENWGNFLDYSQTKLELYLPFIGSVDIDISECMNGTINVQYTVDFITGMCVANVKCTRILPLPSERSVPCVAQHSYQGNCAIQVPLSSQSYGSMVGSLIQASTSGLKGEASGAIQLAETAISGIAPTISTKGSIVANAGFCSVLYPYIRLTRPITAEPESYQTVMGYPSYINTTLGQCTDLCVCDDIDLHTITGATQSELERIRQYCQNGVHV